MEAKNSNLSIVLLDSDNSSILYMQKLISVTKAGNLVAAFEDHRTFIEKKSNFYFDILIVEIDIPGMQGNEIIESIGKERCIIYTSSRHKYEEAIKCHPIDILLKPANEKEIIEVIEKAAKFISKKNTGYQTFNIAEGKGKLMLHANDILYTTTDEVDYRHKTVYLKDGSQYTLMNCTIEKLLRFSPSLIQVNRTETVSLEAIKNVSHDMVTLKILNKNHQNRQVLLSRLYKENLKMFLQNAF